MIWALLALIAAPMLPDPALKPAATSSVEAQVLTFYGLRQLEHDSKVSDEDKAKQWETFILRAKDQIEYAKSAVEHWKNAARARLIDAAQFDESNPDIPPSEKMKRWQLVVDQLPTGDESVQAKKRVAYWKGTEAQRRLLAAQEVERARGTKVQRIKAWMLVVGWADRAQEDAAEQRIAALQDQLYVEALSLDKISRVDDKTKIAAWNDVLEGSPTTEQTRAARRRIASLSR